jgi:hypothetical protein
MPVKNIPDMKRRVPKVAYHTAVGARRRDRNTATRTDLGDGGAGGPDR